jgi:hypothetical protein
MFATTAKAQTPDAQSLDQRVEQLERRVAELERRLQAAEAAPQRPSAAASSVGSGNWKELASWRRLRQGMDMEDVRRLLGEPSRIVVIGDTLWFYGDYANVTFDGQSQKLSGWSEPRGERE